MMRSRRAVPLLLALSACAGPSASKPFVSPRAALVAPAVQRVLIVSPEPIFEVDDSTRQEEPGPPAPVEEALASHDGRVYLGGRDTATTATAVEVQSWLRDTCITPETTGAGVDLDDLRDAAAAHTADLVVYVDTRVHQTTDGRKGAQVGVVAVVTIGVVLAVALVVGAIAGGHGHGGHSGSISFGGGHGTPHPHGHGHLHLALGWSGGYTAGGSTTTIEADACAGRITPPDAHEHGFWINSHIDLAVAIFTPDGELLWYRAGELPAIDDRDALRDHLASFMNGSP